MTVGLWIFDLLLAPALVVLAIRVLTAKDLFQAVVQFIAFGLLMAVVWSRLRAIDIALAEAAIGAGLTGALLLSAIGSARGVKTHGPPARERGSTGRPPHWLLLPAAAAVLACLAGAAWHQPTTASGPLAAEALRQMPASGVSNPVTAVLLNFRSYDTLLEIGVLLLAVVSAWSVVGGGGHRGAIDVAGEADDIRPAGPVLLAFVRTIAPLLVLMSAWLLWQGSKAPGGAFQAGAMLAGAGVLLLAAGIAPRWLPERIDVRVTLSLGFLAFLGTAVGLLLSGRALLEYPPALASPIILAIETVLTVSIAATLAVLFALVSADEPAGKDAAGR